MILKQNPVPSLFHDFLLFRIIIIIILKLLHYKKITSIIKMVVAYDYDITQITSLIIKIISNFGNGDVQKYFFKAVPFMI